jgi:hypothetical protein
VRCIRQQQQTAECHASMLGFGTSACKSINPSLPAAAAGKGTHGVPAQMVMPQRADLQPLQHQRARWAAQGTVAAAGSGRAAA